MRLTWPEAVKRFGIRKVHENASLSDVSAENPALAQDGAAWVKHPGALYVSGTPGSGKTFFAIALLRSLIEKHETHWVIYVKSNDMDDELLGAVEQKQEKWCIQKYLEVPYLFIDDLGVERVSERVLRQYYHIIDFRLENLVPTVFTSNLSMDEINTNLGDRIASRLSVCRQIIFPRKDRRRNVLIN